MIINLKQLLLLYYFLWGGIENNRSNNNNCEFPLMTKVSIYYVPVE